MWKAKLQYLYFEFKFPHPVFQNELRRIFSVVYHTFTLSFHLITFESSCKKKDERLKITGKS